MPLSTEQLDNWFTYHAPTDETTPKYAAVRKGRLDAGLTLLACTAPDCVDSNHIRHESINDALRDFVMVIDANAPDSADKTAAIRCVRLARNAANEAVATPTDSRRLVDIALLEIQKAVWQANSAIACGGK